TAEAQILFEAGQRVGRERSALLDGDPQLVVPIDVVRGSRDEPQLERTRRRDRRPAYGSQRAGAPGIGGKALDEARASLQRGVETAVRLRERDRRAILGGEHVRAIGRQRQLEQRTREARPASDE